VASFFVSRVDSAVDALLPQVTRSAAPRRSRTAKLAYEHFARIFSGDRWGAPGRRRCPRAASVVGLDLDEGSVLSRHEVRRTRSSARTRGHDADGHRRRVRDPAPSARTRSPRISTMQGRPRGAVATGSRWPTSPRSSSRRASRLFAKDFDALLEDDRQQARAGPRRPRASTNDALDDARPRLRTLERMDRDKVVERIWRKDHTVWKDDPTEITDRLGWLTVTDLMTSGSASWRRSRSRRPPTGSRPRVLLGMGARASRRRSSSDVRMRPTARSSSSSWTPRTRDDRAGCGRARARPDPVHRGEQVGRHHRDAQPLRVLLGPAPNGAQFVAITDPGTSLETLAREHGFRAVFLNPGTSAAGTRPFRTSGWCPPR
jgi:hypothetical protein